MVSPEPPSLERRETPLRRGFSFERLREFHSHWEDKEQGEPMVSPEPLPWQYEKPRCGGVFFFRAARGSVTMAQITSRHWPVNMPIEYTLISILIALVQVALYLFVGRAAMFVLAGARRDQNFIYQLFRKGTDFLVKAVRFITPRIVIDKHIPFVAFLLLVWIGLMLIYAKRSICLAQQLNCGL
jgi:hypothetical protein